MGIIRISSIRGISLRLIKEFESFLILIHADFKNLHSLNNFRMSLLKVFYLLLNVFHFKSLRLDIDNIPDRYKLVNSYFK